MVVLGGGAVSYERGTPVHQRVKGARAGGGATREWTRTQMRPSIILQYTTKSIIVSDSGRELTFGVNSPTNLGGLTFKNMSK